MSESDPMPDGATRFKDHSLYRAAMEQMADGDDAGALTKLRELVEMFPEEPVLRDILVRTELRATLATLEPGPSVYGAPAPLLRTVVLVLLAVAVGLAGIVGFTAAYDWLVRPAKQSRQVEMYMDSLRLDGQMRLDAGDWSGAREVYQELLALVPADPTAQAAIEFSDQRQAWDRRYEDAAHAQQRGDWQAALDLLHQIEATSPGYRDVRQRIETLEELETLETGWQQSEAFLQAGDLAGAAATLAQMRVRNPDFHRRQVEERLYQIYAQLARELISQAGGSPDTLREAIGYLDQALALRPTGADLLEERRLAVGYVSGADAFGDEDWATAVDQWEPVYRTRHDYLDGLLEQNLFYAYPRAARQLIARARGTVGLLRRAIVYMDRALTLQPEDEGLTEERRLAVEYVSGATAFAQGDWEAAITHWGEIHASHPTYQDGTLEDKLRQACADVPESDPNLCPP